MQTTGLFESGDALRNTLFDLGLPLLAVIGARNWLVADSPDTAKRFAQPVLEADEDGIREATGPIAVQPLRFWLNLMTWVFRASSRFREEEFAGVLRRASVDRMDLAPDRSIADPIVRFFRMRELRGAHR